MSKSKKEKKAKKKQKQLEKVQAEKQKFDIIELLKTEQLDTKPNFASFLDKYVELISVVVDNGKIQFYPTIEYSFSKILVRFLDKQELMYSKYVLQGEQHYYMYDGLTELKLKSDDCQLLEEFFSNMQKFKFIKEIRD